jgi:hypothetical protein
LGTGLLAIKGKYGTKRCQYKYGYVFVKQCFVPRRTIRK